MWTWLIFPSIWREITRSRRYDCQCCAEEISPFFKSFGHVWNYTLQLYYTQQCKQKGRTTFYGLSGGLLIRSQDQQSHLCFFALEGLTKLLLKQRSFFLIYSSITKCKRKSLYWFKAHFVHFSKPLCRTYTNEIFRVHSTRQLVRKIVSGGYSLRLAKLTSHSVFIL